jgi:hypothetical protein
VVIMYSPPHSLLQDMVLPTFDMIGCHDATEVSRCVIFRANQCDRTHVSSGTPPSKEILRRTVEVGTSKHLHRCCPAAALWLERLDDSFFKTRRPIPFVNGACLVTCATT